MSCCHRWKTCWKVSAAKVIWCHLAQIRYIERAFRYTSAYVEALMKRTPTQKNLLPDHLSICYNHRHPHTYRPDKQG